MPRFWLLGCLVLLGVAAIGMHLGQFHWLGDVVALVAAYLCGLSAVLLLLCAVRRAWRLVAAAGSVLLLTAAPLLTYPSVQPTDTGSSAHSLRVLVYNVYYGNVNLDAAVDVVLRADADVVFLMEYSYAVQQRIETAFAAYPHRLIRPSQYARGHALFSRLPFTTTVVHRVAVTRSPVYEVTFALGAQQVTFVGAHPLPPKLEWGRLHRRQMDEITRIVAHASAPLIVAGDFNAAPWSFTMRRLAQQGQVLPIRTGLVPTATWRPVIGFGLPIDQVLVSANWQVNAQAYGATGGSDHVPVMVDLSLVEPRQPANGSTDLRRCTSFWCAPRRGAQRMEYP